MVALSIRSSYSSSRRVSIASFVCAALLFGVVSGAKDEADSSTSSIPNLRSRYLASQDPDHDGSIVKIHSIEHDKFHGRRVLETVGVGLHVWVAYRNPDGKTHVHGNLTSVGYEMETYKAVAGVLPSLDQLMSMLEDGNIDWIAEDSILKGAGETEPYGVEFVTQNEYAPNQNVAQGSSASCSNPNTFKIGIVDTGTSIL